MWKFLTTLIDNLLRRKPTPVAPAVPFQIIDIVNQLEWHTTRRWAKRGLKQIQKIVVHQAYASYKKTTLEGVNKYHITPSPDNHLSPNGAPHIAYHYCIIGDGTIYQTNYLSNSTWHCAGENTKSIGILVLGDFHGPTRVGADGHPTRNQLVNLERLLNDLIELPELNISSQDVYGHKDFGKQNCPGIAVARFLEEYKN